MEYVKLIIYIMNEFVKTYSKWKKVKLPIIINNFCCDNDYCRIRSTFKQNSHNLSTNPISFK